MYLFENSSFNGWASVSNFDSKIFIPHLDDGHDILGSTKSTSESCSVVYRGKLYVYGLGSTNFYIIILSVYFA